MSNTETFQWSDETVKEFVNICRRPYGFSIDSYMSEFKKSKQPKKDWEVIAVDDPRRGILNAENGSDFKYVETDIIHTIRRLSDGEVFSRQDTVSFGGDCNIRSFEIIDGEMHAVLGVFRPNIKHLSKKKQPLFTTTDGKPVYAGDKIWYVASDLYIGSYKVAANSHSQTKDKLFPTEEAAKEYVLMNKPQLSIQQISDWLIKNDHFRSPEYICNKLKDLVKQNQ